MGSLRLILALSVVAAHAGAYFGKISLIGGTAAVEAFFIISGFYMTLILNEKYVGKGSYRLFITNRFLKLYPVYWTVLLIAIIVTLFSIKLHDQVGLEQFIKYFGEMRAGSFFYAIASNVVLFGQDTALFLHLVNGGVEFTNNFWSTDPQVWKFMFVPPAWSLGLELMFYLIAPFLVRRSLSKLIPLILISLLLKCFILFVVGWTNDPWTYRFFPSELAYFLSGCISYKLYQKINLNVAKYQGFGKYLLALIFIVTIFYMSVHISAIIKSLLFCSLLVFSIPFIFLWSKRKSIDKLLGELSYPVYISHWLIISILTAMGLQNYTSIFPIIVALISIIFSILLVNLMMNPIENFRQSRLKKDSNPNVNRTKISA